MTNKKKQASGSKAAASKKKTSPSTNNKDGAPPETSQPRAQPKGAFTSPQLTALIFIAMGVSRLLEWKRAVHEVTAQTESHVNGTGACQAYMRTTIKSDDDDNQSDVQEVDYDFVCNSPVTRLLMQLKYDSSLQIIAMVVYLSLQCWNNERLLHRINTCLFLVPISSTLVLLQLCMPYLESSKTSSLTLMCSVLMAVAGPPAVTSMKEMLQGGGRPAYTRGTIQSLFLSGMVFLHFYDMYQWWCTAQVGANAVTTTTSSVLSVTTLTVDNEWTDAWKVFFYFMIMDKLTISLLLTCVWFSFEDYRQRNFLACCAVLKCVEHQYQMVQYANADEVFTDYKLKQNTILVTGVFATIAWLAPSFGFNAAANAKKQKLS